jgi:hypothetical protein
LRNIAIKELKLPSKTLEMQRQYFKRERFT